MAAPMESDLDPDPFAQFARWFEEAKAAVKDLPECMMLATASREGEVSTCYREGAIPRPPHWGGYRVIPILFEFWQGRSDRLHDRFAYRLRDAKDWVIERLSP